MPIQEVCKEDHRQLQNIANVVASSKKIVVITGAGISTNCGIPDFRSEAGLYALMQLQHDGANDSTAAIKLPLQDLKLLPATQCQKAPTNIKGKDLFDAVLWKDPLSTSVFCRFIASLRKNIREEVKHTSPTHRFVRTLRDSRKLVRCYTQNIDGLETREGLCADFGRGKGNRARFTKRVLEKPRAAARILPGGDLDGGCEVVQLHGNLEVLRCNLCQKTCGWNDKGREKLLLDGKAPECLSCAVYDRERQNRGKRGTKVGALRPNVVLYGEEHPAADILGTITAHDLTLAPDVLLILGTSLHVHGLKILVKEFAKSVQARTGGKGKVIYVNLSKPSESIWKDYFDFWVSMDCDEWVGALRQHRPDLWQVQRDLKLQVMKRDGKQFQKADLGKITVFDDDKENQDLNIPTTLDAKSSRPIAKAKTRKPLQDTANNASQLASVHGASSRKPIASKFCEQVPTPPPSDHRARLQNPLKRSRGLHDVEIPKTISKKARVDV